MDSFAELVKPGDSGEMPLTAKQLDASELFRRLTTTDESERMPAESPPLDKEQIAIMSSWIQAGAEFDGKDPTMVLGFVIPPPTHQAAPDQYQTTLPITSVVFSPSGDEIISSGYHELLVWDSTGQLLRRIGNVGQRSFAMEFSEDGKSLIVAGGQPGVSGEVRVIDFATGEVRGVVVRSPDVALDVAIRPQSNQLAVACADKTIRIVDLESLELLRTIGSHADWVTSVAWSSDGTRLVSTSRDKSAKVYDGESGQLLSSYLGHSNSVRGAVFTANSEVVSTGSDGKLHRWKADTAKVVKQIPLGGEAYKPVDTGDSVWVPSASHHFLRVNLSENKLDSKLSGHQDWVLSAAASKDKAWLVSGSFDGKLCLWRASDASLIRTWSAQP